MTMVDEQLVTEAKISALSKARSALKDQIKHIHNEPVKPWEHKDFRDEIGAAKEALRQIDDEIISLEGTLRDAEQDAEFRAEFYAEARMLGVHDDINLYMHTPHQELLFQEQIENQVNYGYYSEEEGWIDGLYSGNEGYGSCETCKTMTDEWSTCDGWNTCHNCVGDVVCWMNFLGLVTNTEVVETGRWGDEFMFKVEDDPEG